METLKILIYISALAFIYFGFNCFFSKFIISEFDRYNLPNYRKLTGLLQLMGSAGLFFGLYYSPLITLLASTGLFFLMIAGFIVRIKIKDDFIKSSPSFMFAALNLFIAIKTGIDFF